MTKNKQVTNIIDDVAFIGKCYKFMIKGAVNCVKFGIRSFGVFKIMKHFKIKKNKRLG